MASSNSYHQTHPVYVRMCIAMHMTHTYVGTSAIAPQGISTDIQQAAWTEHVCTYIHVRIHVHCMYAVHSIHMYGPPMELYLHLSAVSCEEGAPNTLYAYS